MSARWRWAAFALLCTVAASAWIATTAWPTDLPPLLRSGLENLMLCLVALPLARHRWIGTGWQRWAEIAAWGTVLLNLPVLVASGAAPEISPIAESLIFTAVPAVVVLTAAYRDEGAAAGSHSQLGAAIAGLAGAVFVLPFTLPESAGGTVWLGATMLAAVLAGVAIVKLRPLLTGINLSPAIVVVCAASGVLDLAFWILHPGPRPDWKALSWGHEAAFFAVVAAPVWALTLWLVRDLEPARFSSRFLLVPLLTVIEGVILLRPGLSWTLALGIALMVFASWRLLSESSEALETRVDDSPDAPPV